MLLGTEYRFVNICNQIVMIIIIVIIIIIIMLFMLRQC